MLSIGEFLMHYIAYAIGINLLKVVVFFFVMKGYHFMTGLFYTFDLEWDIVREKAQRQPKKLNEEREKKRCTIINPSI